MSWSIRISTLSIRILRKALVAVLPAFFCAVAMGQTGRITGRVTDQGGAVVPGVAVTVTQTATNTSRVVQTNEEGYYTAPSLLPGEYSLTFERQGFKPTVQSGLTLQVSQDLRLDVTLQVGAITEKVEVTAEAPLLETETHSAGQVVQERQVTGLPLLGRDAYALGSLVPGVRTSRGMNDLPVDIISTSSISINGAQATANEFLLDGAPNTAAAANQPIVYPNADAVQEFKVETSNYSAEFGRAAGGVFNVVTKAGTNSLHGALWEFLRNDKLNANNFFANQAGQKIPPLKFNQFGGVLGGPVVLPKVYNGRNRTFFFVATEEVRYIQGVTYTATVPNPGYLSGDFSRDVNAAGNSVTIYNPFSTRANPSGTGYIRDPFPGNVIPSNLLNPIAVKMATYFPAPNAPGTGPTRQNNYVRTDSNKIDKNTWSARLDHNATDSTRFFVRYSYDDSPYVRASPYGFDNVGSPAFGAQDFTRYNAVAEVNHIFSPTLISTLRGSFSRLANVRGPISQGFDITQLGFPPDLGPQVGAPAAFPVVTITGYGVSSSVPNSAWTSALGETGLIQMGMNNYALQANATKTLQSHTLKAGVEFRVVQFNTLQTGDASNNFAFTSAFTQGPNPAQTSATAGDALASFLLGTSASGNVTPSPALALQTKYYAGFIQDDWKVTSRLTLNLGLRYEYETPRKDRYNQLTNFDYNAVPPLNAPGLNLRGTLAFPGVNGASRYQANPDTNNFGPRAGFAWHPISKTVIRGGAGIFYGNYWGIGGAPGAFGVSGFSAATDMASSLDGVTPNVILSNPYPQGLNRATGSSAGPATLLGQSVTFFDRNNVTPYTVQYNFDIQRELPYALLLDVGYVGTHNLKLPANQTLNQLPDSALALGDALRTQVPNPFYGQIMVGALAAKTVSRAQLLVPYPQFTGVASQATNWAASRYNALQVKLEKRFSRGFTMLASYTWSKMMDQSTGSFSGETLGGGAIQDWNNLNAEWSPSQLDQTHRFIVNSVMELPFFRNQSGIAGHVLGGWELGILGSFYSGSPLGVSSAVNGTFSQGSGQRPNWNGVNPSISNPTPAKWFDTSVFGIPAPYTFGTTPRTFNGARGDWTRQVDLSLHKNTHITERLMLQIRADAFNLSNTVVFAPPNTSFGANGFGSVSAQANQPRVLQFALKLIF
jgi:hypothetical protein